MFYFKLVIAAAAVAGALDSLLGNRLRLGEEFEKGFRLWSSMALSMIGMLILAPWIADILSPVFGWIAEHTPFDPSVLPASLFANDMGGSVLCTQIATDENIGRFNAFVVTSMMGCTVSFTLPLSFGMVKKEQQTGLFQGILCGIITIPVGCFVSGLMMGLPVLKLLLDLLPLLILAVIISVGLLKAPKICVNVFKVISYIMKVMITVGLCIGIIEFIPGIRIMKDPDCYTDAAMVCVSAATILTGMFPLLSVLSRLLKKPMAFVAGRLGINNDSSMGLISTLATNVATFGAMDRMNERGVVINSAFAVSAAFVFGGHLSYTMVYCEEAVPYVIAGKLVSGISAVAVALLFLKLNSGKDLDK